MSTSSILPPPPPDYQCARCFTDYRNWEKVKVDGIVKYETIADTKDYIPRTRLCRYHFNLHSSLQPFVFDPIDETDRSFTLAGILFKIDDSDPFIIDWHNAMKGSSSSKTVTFEQVQKVKEGLQKMDAAFTKALCDTKEITTVDDMSSTNALATTAIDTILLRSNWQKEVLIYTLKLPYIVLDLESILSKHLSASILVAERMGKELNEINYLERPISLSTPLTRTLDFVTRHRSLLLKHTGKQLQYDGHHWRCCDQLATTKSEAEGCWCAEKHMPTGKVDDQLMYRLVDDDLDKGVEQSVSINKLVTDKTDSVDRLWELMYGAPKQLLAASDVDKNKAVLRAICSICFDSKGDLVYQRLLHKSTEYGGESLTDLLTTERMKEAFIQSAASIIADCRKHYIQEENQIKERKITADTVSGNRNDLVLLSTKYTNFTELSRLLPSLEAQDNKQKDKYKQVMLDLTECDTKCTEVTNALKVKTTMTIPEAKKETKKVDDAFTALEASVTSWTMETTKLDTDIKSSNQLIETLKTIQSSCTTKYEGKVDTVQASPVDKTVIKMNMETALLQAAKYKTYTSLQNAISALNTAWTNADTTLEAEVITKATACKTKCDSCETNSTSVTDAKNCETELDNLIADFSTTVTKRTTAYSLVKTLIRSVDQLTKDAEEMDDIETQIAEKATAFNASITKLEAHHADIRRMETKLVNLYPVSLPPSTNTETEVHAFLNQHKKFQAFHTYITGFDHVKTIQTANQSTFDADKTLASAKAYKSELDERNGEMNTKLTEVMQLHDRIQKVDEQVDKLEVLDAARKKLTAAKIGDNKKEAATIHGRIEKSISNASTSHNNNLNEAKKTYTDSIGLHVVEVDAKNILLQQQQHEELITNSMNEQGQMKNKAAVTLTTVNNSTAEKTVIDAVLELTGLHRDIENNIKHAAELVTKMKEDGDALLLDLQARKKKKEDGVNRIRKEEKEWKEKKFDTLSKECTSKSQDAKTGYTALLQLATSHPFLHADDIDTTNSLQTRYNNNINGKLITLAGDFPSKITVDDSDEDIHKAEIGLKKVMASYDASHSNLLTVIQQWIQDQQMTMNHLTTLNLTNQGKVKQDFHTFKTGHATLFKTLMTDIQVCEGRILTMQKNGQQIISACKDAEKDKMLKLGVIQNIKETTEQKCGINQLSEFTKKVDTIRNEMKLVFDGIKNEKESSATVEKIKSWKSTILTNKTNLFSVKGSLDTFGKQDGATLVAIEIGKLKVQQYFDSIDAVKDDYESRKNGLPTTELQDENFKKEEDSFYHEIQEIKKAHRSSVSNITNIGEANLALSTIKDYYELLQNHTVYKLLDDIRISAKKLNTSSLSSSSAVSYPPLTRASVVVRTPTSIPTPVVPVKPIKLGDDEVKTFHSIMEKWLLIPLKTVSNPGKDVEDPLTTSITDAYSNADISNVSASLTELPDLKAIKWSLVLTLIVNGSSTIDKYFKNTRDKITTELNTKRFTNTNDYHTLYWLAYETAVDLMGSVSSSIPDIDATLITIPTLTAEFTPEYVFPVWFCLSSLALYSERKKITDVTQWITSMAAALLTPATVNQKYTKEELNQLLFCARMAAALCWNTVRGFTIPFNLTVPTGDKSIRTLYTFWRTLYNDIFVTSLSDASNETLRNELNTKLAAFSVPANILKELDATTILPATRSTDPKQSLAKVHSILEQWLLNPVKEKVNKTKEEDTFTSALKVEYNDVIVASSSSTIDKLPFSSSATNPDVWTNLPSSIASSVQNKSVGKNLFLYSLFTTTFGTNINSIHTPVQVCMYLASDALCKLLPKKKGDYDAQMIATDYGINYTTNTVDALYTLPMWLVLACMDVHGRYSTPTDKANDYLAPIQTLTKLFLAKSRTENNPSSVPIVERNQLFFMTRMALALLCSHFEKTKPIKYPTLNSFKKLATNPTFNSFYQFWKLFHTANKENTWFTTFVIPDTILQALDESASPDSSSSSSSSSSSPSAPAFSETDFQSGDHGHLVTDNTLEAQIRQHISAVDKYHDLPIKEVVIDDKYLKDLDAMLLDF